MFEHEREVMLLSVPDYAAILLANGFIDCKIDSESPVNTPVIAYTTADKERKCWVVTFHPRAIELSVAAREALWRHELGHIVFNHFAQENCRPDNLELGTQEALIVGDIQINFYLLNTQELMDEIGNKVKEIILDETGNVINGLGYINPLEELPKINLAVSEYSYEIIHAAYHQKLEEQLDSDGSTSQQYSYCGGIEQVNSGDMATPSTMVSVVAQNSSEFSVGVGSSISTDYVSMLGTEKPQWLLEVEKFARSIVKVNLVSKRAHTKPQPIYKHYNIHVPTKKPKWSSIPQQVCFLIDTSGSMADNLKYCVPVINYLNANNISVRLIAGDTVVTTDEEFKPGSKMPNKIVGGGGTEITPLFDRAKEYNPASIICFTDGWVPKWPTNPGVPTLWVGCAVSVPFGTKA